MYYLSYLDIIHYHIYSLWLPIKRYGSNVTCCSKIDFKKKDVENCRISEQMQCLLKNMHFLKMWKLVALCIENHVFSKDAEKWGCFA